VVVGSFFGDAWRLLATAVVMVGILGIWYLVISRFGSMLVFDSDADRVVAAARAETEPYLAHPRFERGERLVVRMLVGINVVMGVQMTLFVPYFIVRFGWST
jgi:hypothetical protein